MKKLDFLQQKNLILRLLGDLPCLLDRAADWIDQRIPHAWVHPELNKTNVGSWSLIDNKRQRYTCTKIETENKSDLLFVSLDHHSLYIMHCRWHCCCHQNAIDIKSAHINSAIWYLLLVFLQLIYKVKRSRH